MSGHLPNCRSRDGVSSCDCQLLRDVVDPAEVARNPALGAGTNVDIWRSGPTGRIPASVDKATLELADLRNRRCSECGVERVARLSRTGVCRRCQWSLGQRRSRARRSR
jgi:hypothetical protein